MLVTRSHSWRIATVSGGSWKLAQRELLVLLQDEVEIALWEIENPGALVRDVILDEDCSQVRTAQQPRR
jgi:hypothetical protein